METKEIYLRLQQVFDAVFLDQVNVSPTLSAKDVDEWDSVMHVSLVLSIEDAFGITFKVGEVESTKNVGDLADLISRRLGTK